MYERSPVQMLMDELANNAWCRGEFGLSRSVRYQSKPGEMIMGLPPEKRELLKTLRSEDIATDGIRYIWAQQQVAEWDTHVRIFGPLKEFEG
jgi:hypothetical protein